MILIFLFLFVSKILDLLLLMSQTYTNGQKKNNTLIFFQI